MSCLFSIIIATYNSEVFLERTIKSITEQQFKDFEIVVVDGGSTDNTLNIINKFKERISAFISEKDNGIYDAWNKGIALSSGQWIMFIGSDDVLLPNGLESYSRYLDDNSMIKFNYVSSRVDLIDHKRKILRTIGKPWKWSLFRKYMCVAHVGSIHHHSLYENYGFYNIEYKITGDYEMLLRAQDKLKAGFLKTVTVQMQVGGVSGGSKALDEAFKAKISSGARSVYMAKFDRRIAKIKLALKDVFNL